MRFWTISVSVRGMPDAGEREQFRFRLLDAVEKMTGLAPDDYGVFGPFDLPSAIRIVQKLARSRYNKFVNIALENR